MLEKYVLQTDWQNTNLQLTKNILTVTHTRISVLFRIRREIFF